MGGQRLQMKSQLERFFEVDRRRTRRLSSGDADDVFGELNGDCNDYSTWSLASDQRSETTSPDSGTTQYDTLSDLRGSDARLSTTPRNNDERPASTKVKTKRDRRRQVERVFSENNVEKEYKYRTTRRTVRRLVCLQCRVYT